MSDLNAVAGSIRNVAEFRELCISHATRTKVSPAPNGEPDWHVSQKRLENKKSDYFNVGLYVASPSQTIYLLEQRESAVVLLLLAKVEDRSFALIQPRSEPGLIGLVNLTTTIQSTPNNFRREHGGRATPFVDVVADPSRFGEVIYDGFQFDWGDYYLRKTKRFLVVELPSLVEAPSGFIWTDLSLLAELMREDHLVSTDLRCCFNHVFADRGRSHCPAPAVNFDVARPALVETDFSTSAADSRGAKIGYYQCSTLTREVTEWTQPLVIPPAGFDAHLHFMYRQGQRFFAVTQATQAGLLGTRLWFPAGLEGGTIIDEALNCAEGGRFWRTPVHVSLREVSPEYSDSTSENVNWINEDQLSRLISKPLQTSLELRLAWSLILSRRICPT